MTEKSSGQCNTTVTTVTIDVAQKSATTAHYQGKLTGSSAGGSTPATGNSSAASGGNSTGGKK